MTICWFYKIWSSSKDWRTCHKKPVCPLNVRCCTLQCWLRCSGHQLHWVSVSSGPKLAFLAFSTLRTLLKTSQASKIPNWRGKSWARGGYDTFWLNLNKFSSWRFDLYSPLDRPRFNSRFKTHTGFELHQLDIENTLMSKYLKRIKAKGGQ